MPSSLQVPDKPRVPRSRDRIEINIPVKAIEPLGKYLFKPVAIACAVVVVAVLVTVLVYNGRDAAAVVAAVLGLAKIWP
ncbi:MAG: hypothetical protein Q8P18_18255 [Pseudomonadota bacterium]|nr:hypothetical protein [Pseudomonadota bacterium]